MSEMSSEPGSTRQKQAHRQRRTRTVLIVLTVTWVLALFPAGAFALMSPFAFDSGTSEGAWRVFIGLIGMPVVLVLSTLIAWVLFGLKKYTAAIVLVLAPLVYFVAFLFIA
jgi:hypothetical protein